MNKDGNMAVLGRLKTMEKNGNTEPLRLYKSLHGEEKLQFALQLKMDRTAAFLSCQEYKKAETIATDEVKDGWLTEAMIANMQGLTNYTKDESQRQRLAEFMEGLPTKPHERKVLLCGHGALIQQVPEESWDVCFCRG
jgi:hypothetical protein